MDEHSTINLYILIQKIFLYEPNIYHMIFQIFEIIYKKHYAIKCIQFLRTCKRPMGLYLMRNFCNESDNLHMAYQNIFNIQKDGKGIYFAKYARAHPDPDQSFIGILTPNQILNLIPADDVIKLAHIGIFTKLIHNSNGIYSRLLLASGKQIHGIMMGNTVERRYSTPLIKKIKLDESLEKNVNGGRTFFEILLYGINSHEYTDSIELYSFNYNIKTGHKGINLFTTKDDIVLKKHVIDNHSVIQLS